MNKLTLQEISEIYHLPLLDLVYRAASVHRENHPANEVQKCTLLSIKTGGCAENCSYCPQSAHYNTGVKAEKLMEVEDVLEKARQAKRSGSTRFCMGAAWKKVRDSNDFEKVLSMIKGVKALNMECCVTLGTLTDEQALRLKEAGLSAYNHNLDTSEEYYPKIITTRTYQERLDTLESVMDAGISVCCGGIIGMGESEEDRIKLLLTLQNLKTPPESIPVNALVPSKGTPLEKRAAVSPFELVRMIATTRIVFPTSMVRLSAGRLSLSLMEQAFCFMAGANSIFTGEKLLTTPNPGIDADDQLFKLLGLSAKPADIAPSSCCSSDEKEMSCCSSEEPEMSCCSPQETKTSCCSTKSSCCG